MSVSSQAISVCLLCADSQLEAAIRGALDETFELRIGQELGRSRGARVVVLDARLEGAEVLAFRLRARPLVVLADAGQKIPGDPDVVLPRPPEAESLGRGIRRALALNALERDFDETRLALERCNQRLAAADQETERVRERIESLQRKLEEANGRNFQFLRQTVHELRTPLNAIMGFSGILLRKTRGLLDQRQSGNLQQIQDSARQLRALIDNMLEFERLGAEEVRLKLEPMDCGTLAAELEQEYRPRAQARGLGFTAHVEKPPLRLRIDRGRLRALLDHLLTNALAFSEQGTVRVDFRRFPAQGPREVRISVIDQGMGIPTEEQQRIFQPYTKGEGLATAGMGLALATRLSDVMGGTLAVESAAGKGSTFTFSMGQSTILEPVSLPPLGQGPNVLVVDDEIPVLEILRHLLSEAGFRVHAVNSGDAGLELAYNLKPKVMIVDVMMPGIGGLQIARELRRDPTTATIPVVVWSGTEERPDDAESRVAAWLTKPFDFDEVVDVVRRLAKR